MSDVTPTGDTAAWLRTRADALEAVAVANAKNVQAGLELRAAILAAHEADAGAGNIAAAAGLSRARIYQIIAEEEKT